MSFALALQNEKLAANNVLSKLIVADIAPSTGDLSPDFVRYISAMQEIEALAPGVIKTRTDADKRLQSYEQVMSFLSFKLYPVTFANNIQDKSIRQFLLTNLQPPIPSRSGSHDTSHEKAKFIVPLDILESSIGALGSFPYKYDKENQTVPTTWDGPTLVVKGGKSA